MGNLSKRIFLCVLALTLAVAEPAMPVIFGGCQKVEASSKKPSKKTVKRIYKKFLEKGKYKSYDLNYFYVLDINRDGVSELICFNQYWDNSLFVFTVKKGRLVSLGTSGSHTGFREIPKLYYSRKYKALCYTEKVASFGGGCIGPRYEYYRISGSRMRRWKYTAKMGVSLSHYDYFQIGNGAERKYVSKKKQKSFYNKYFKPKYIKEYELLKNTPEARESVLDE